MALGMTTIGHVARTSLAALKQKFRARFGKQSDIQAEVMWRTANGLDDSLKSVDFSVDLDLTLLWGLFHFNNPKSLQTEWLFLF